MNNSLENFTSNVLKAYSAIDNPRVKVLIQTLINYLHSYIKETNLTINEWEFTWDFLAKMAEFTHADRNEFLLLADVLGVSQLIEMSNHQRPGDSVGFALVGPFYRANAPLRARGASIASEGTQGKRVKITGRVINIQDSKPIANAVLDIWQCANNGLYESQDPNQPEMNLRGKFTTDADGTFELTALFPTSYPVPTDGPVGDLLAISKRHPYRPAHIHFVVSAPEYEVLVTQVFVAEDELVKTDVVFTASDNMMGKFLKEDDQYSLNFDFQLTPGKYCYPVAPIK